MNSRTPGCWHNVAGFCGRIFAPLSCAKSDTPLAKMPAARFGSGNNGPGKKQIRLRSGLYIDNAEGAPRRDEQNPLGDDPPRDYMLS